MAVFRLGSVIDGHVTVSVDFTTQTGLVNFITVVNGSAFPVYVLLADDTAGTRFEQTIPANASGDYPTSGVSVPRGANDTRHIRHTIRWPA